MPAGTIKQLIKQRRHGIILADGGEEVLFHHAVVDGKQYGQLREGQRVEYTLLDPPRGTEPRASLVIGR